MFLKIPDKKKYLPEFVNNLENYHEKWWLLKSTIVTV